MSTGRVSVLLDAPDESWEEMREALPRALAEAGIDAILARDLPPEEVDWIVHAPGAEPLDFRRFPRARAVLSLWAGVERLLQNPTLTLPLARMVEPGMTQGMTEWVLGHALRHHLGLDAVRDARTWAPAPPPLASERPVTVLGLGELGLAAATALHGLGFPVTGWSRRPKDAPFRTLSGEDGLDAALGGAEIVVLLLPRTAGTEGLMDARRLRLAAPGYVLLNPARGALVDEDALLVALDEGAVGHATLDVFRQEPLPDAHPFWAHPRVTVSPHVAAATRPLTSARAIAENIRRGLAGLPLLNLVDRAAGY